MATSTNTSRHALTIRGRRQAGALAAIDLGGQLAHDELAPAAASSTPGSVSP